MNFLTLHSTKCNRRALQELLCTCRNGQGKRPHTASTQKSGACPAHCGEYTMCFRQHKRHSPHPNFLPAHSVERIV